MKPGYRPGKPATAGKSTRQTLAKAKPAILKAKKAVKKTTRKEGQGGKRKDLDFSEAPKKRMKGAEYEVFSHEGVRRLPKKQCH